MSSLPRVDDPRFRPNVNVLEVVGAVDPNAPLTELLLADGRIVRISTEALMERVEHEEPERAVPNLDETDASELVVPVVEERLLVGKRVVPTGKVRLRKSVQEFDTVLDVVLAVRSYDVERVLLNQPVALAPAVRSEGSTTIYPIVEEQLVVTRQLILKEEVRVTCRDTERRDTRPITLKREVVEIEREGET